MSGRRHHYIPQFLQRGFSCSASNKEDYVWVYRKGNLNPFKANTKNIGVEGDFYSNDKESALDDVITDLESNLGEFVNRLRIHQDGSLVDAKMAAKLIAHMEARTKNLRLNIQHASEAIMTAVVTYFDNPKNIDSYITKIIKNQCDDLIKEELKKNNIPQHLASLYKPKLQPLIDKQLESLPFYLQGLMVHLKEYMLSGMSKSSKESHISALLKAHTPPIKQASYEKLKFSIFESEALPLGDSIVVFHTDSEKQFKTTFELKDTLFAVTLPIAHNKILVGSSTEYKLDYEVICDAIIQCSSQYFIASENSSYLTTLIPEIGMKSGFLSDEEMEILIDDCFNDLAKDNF